MKALQWTSFVVIAAVLFLRGLWPAVFTIDSYSVAILFLLAIPLVAPFVKHAKWFGAEFVFKDEIDRVSLLVQQSEAKAQEAAKEGATRIAELETFSTTRPRELLDTDPNLSLAALRLEIERVLSFAVTNLFGEPSVRRPMCSTYIGQLLKERILSEEQGGALKMIVQMCNKAVHGADVSEDEAKDIISLTERLNNSFSAGYSINFSRNEDFEQQGLLCEWEHCVEHFPLRDPPEEQSCPEFGHDCPGGKVVRKACAKTVADIAKRMSKGCRSGERILTGSLILF